ncbi:MAG: HAD family hydrolase [Patescibacteria group bacterium]
MIKAILSDFARVILFPKDENYKSRLDILEKKLKRNLGNYNVFDYFRLNQEILVFFQSIKTKIPLYIYTSGSNYETPGVYEQLVPIFKDFFYSVALEIDKTDSDSYIFLANKLHLAPENIFFIDDDEKNIHAAQKAGLQTHWYKDNQTLLTDLRKRLKI